MSDLTHYTDPATGHEYALGNLMPPDGVRCSWPVYGDVPTTPMVPRDQWDQYCDPGAVSWGLLPPVHYQDGVGCCNASATAAAVELCRAVAGLPYVALSAGDLYGRINGGVDRGSLLEDGLREAMDRGIADVATVPYLDWRGRPAGVDQVRRRYRVLEAFLLPTFDHVMSASIHRYSIISGIMWREGYKVDADGWLTNPVGRQGGHAVLGYAPARRGKEYGVWHQNSWGEKWGRGGRCVFPEWAYQGPVGGWWAARLVTTEGGDVPAPKGGGQ